MKTNGDPCRGYQLGKAGVQKLLDGGHALVSDPESFCAYHARTAELATADVRGVEARSPEACTRSSARSAERDVIDRETKLAAYKLIRSLVDATIPDTQPVEPDVKKRAVGVYLAAHLCAQPDDRMVFAHSLLPRDLQHRDDI